MEASPGTPTPSPSSPSTPQRRWGLGRAVAGPHAARRDRRGCGVGGMFHGSFLAMGGVQVDEVTDDGLDTSSEYTPTPREEV